MGPIESGRELVELVEFVEFVEFVELVTGQGAMSPSGSLGSSVISAHRGNRS